MTLEEFKSKPNYIGAFRCVLDNSVSAVLTSSFQDGTMCLLAYKVDDDTWPRFAVHNPVIFQTGNFEVIDYVSPVALEAIAGKDDDK